MNLFNFIKSHNKIATVTSIQWTQGLVEWMLGSDGEVLSFREKAKDESKWINGGFFVLKPEGV